VQTTVVLEGNLYINTVQVKTNSRLAFWKMSQLLNM